MRSWINLVENKYHTGLCDAMAIALHRLYGYELAVWRGFFPDEFGDDGDEAYQDCHACVVLPDGRWADVDGIHKGIPDNLIFTDPVERVELVTVTEDEMKYLFTVEGVSEDQIKMAMSEAPKLRAG